MRYPGLQVEAISMISICIICEASCILRHHRSSCMVVNLAWAHFARTGRLLGECFPVGSSEFGGYSELSFFMVGYYLRAMEMKLSLCIPHVAHYNIIRNTSFLKSHILLLANAPSLVLQNVCLVLRGCEDYSVRKENYDMAMPPSSVRKTEAKDQI